MRIQFASATRPRVLCSLHEYSVCKFSSSATRLSTSSHEFTSVHARITRAREFPCRILSGGGPTPDQPRRSREFCRTFQVRSLNPCGSIRQGISSNRPVHAFFHVLHAFCAFSSFDEDMIPTQFKKRRRHTRAIHGVENRVAPYATFGKQSRGRLMDRSMTPAGQRGHTDHRHRPCRRLGYGNRIQCQRNQIAVVSGDLSTADCIADVDLILRRIR